jgi:prophage regulatory protein
MSTKLIRIKDVMDLTGLARSTIYKYMKQGEFPQSVKLGSRAVAWVESEIEDWNKDRITRRGSAVI